MNCFKCGKFCKIFSLKEDFYIFLEKKISLVFLANINFCKSCKICYQQDNDIFMYFKLNDKNKPIYSVVYYFNNPKFDYYCFKKRQILVRLDYVENLKFNEVFNYGEKYLDNILFL